ncbi:MAG: ribosome silencing factor [Bacteroidales bacterium]|nr:ribosome silencing factor [Candidatus Physcousia equi]
MIHTEQLVDAVIEGLQDKKGQCITLVNLTQIDDTICRYFVLCTAGSPSQSQALARSVDNKVLQAGGGHPATVAGQHHSLWVALDYGDVMVHIFLPEERAFYDLEHLWADAQLTEIPSED